MKRIDYLKLMKRKNLTERRLVAMQQRHVKQGYKVMYQTSVRIQTDVQIKKQLNKLSDHYCEIRNTLQEMVGGGRAEEWGGEDYAISSQREGLADLLKQHLEVVEEYEWNIDSTLETQFKNLMLI